MIKKMKMKYNGKLFIDRAKTGCRRHKPATSILRRRNTSLGTEKVALAVKKLTCNLVNVEFQVINVKGKKDR